MQALCRLAEGSYGWPRHIKASSGSLDSVRIGLLSSPLVLSHHLDCWGDQIGDWHSQHTPSVVRDHLLAVLILAARIWVWPAPSGEAAEPGLSDRAG